MEERKFRELAIKSVIDYFNEQSDSTDKNGTIDEKNVFCCMGVQNFTK